MWRIIQQQQREIEALNSRQNKTEEKVEKTDQKVEAAGEMVEQVQKEGGTGWWNHTSLGGYGELHYNGGRKDEIDFHRFVLFVGHEFNDDIRLFSEIEFEHAVVGKDGDVELEQAWLEFDLFDDRHHARGGLMLVPVGILNETHEPPTFFGVERNLVETNIIPTTWWEGGAGLHGQIADGFSYDLFVHSGLKTPTSGAKAFKIRDGRQKLSKARAEDGAFTGRVKWTGMPGVEVGVTGQYQVDVTQGAQNPLVTGRDLNVGATLFEAHANVRRGPYGFRALYARWDLFGSAAEAIGRDVQHGWYVEPSYRFDTEIGEFGVFARYLEFDNEAGNSADTGFRQLDTGLNYWPHPDVVLKFDFNFQRAPRGVKRDNRANLGLGFQL